MRQHSKNALEVAEFLKKHPQVSWLSFAGLKDSPWHAHAKRYMKDGLCSGLFTFGLKGGHKAGVALVENVKIFRHLANIGDTKSLIIHPALEFAKVAAFVQKKIISTCISITSILRCCTNGCLVSRNRAKSFLA